MGPNDCQERVDDAWMSRTKLNIRLVLLATAFIFLSTWSIVHWVGRFHQWIQVISDSQSVMQWEGFRKEEGLYNFTVVTALLDIGRGSWGHQSRKYNQYLLYMQRVLKLDINLVVFVDIKGKPFVEWMRRGREKRTRIVVTSLVNLPYYRYRARMSDIMASPEYKENNELVDKRLCESNVPEYDIVQLSKLYFINSTVWENPFSTSYFMWIDGGYAHGHDVFPRNKVWIPKNLFEFSNKVTFMERPPGVKHFEKDKDKLHKMSVNILAGNFFAGGAGALKELCEMQSVLVDEWMRNGVVDDDQTAYMLMYYRKPSLFHLVPGDWKDVFYLFNVQENSK